MKYYTFHRENNDFSDILSDTNIKKVVDTKVSWWTYLMIGIEEKNNSGTFSYITLKYGDEMVSSVVRDFSPIPGVDYTPKKNINDFRKKVSKD